MQNELLTKYEKVLELESVLNSVAFEALCEDSKNEIKQTRPCYNYETALLQLQKTKDAYDLAAKFGSVRISKISSVKEPLARAGAGGNLSLEQLLNIAEVLRNVRGVCQWHEQCAGITTTLDNFFESLFPNKYFEEKIFNAIVSEDTVSDAASLKLAEIRRNIRKENQQIRTSLDKFIKSQSRQKQLQDAIVTQRDGRYVIPVKQEYRSEIDGIVHDTSASGATIFIEPTSVVEANNKIRILQAQEKDEIIRIIAELSAEAASFSESIILSYEAMIQIDICFAKANYAYKTKSVMPVLNNNGVIDIKKARHPLINKNSVVPIDVQLGKNFDVLVITGPNTGGKTVALKTLGLFSLMSMCGLMLPCMDGSIISVFENGIFADIGDEQSIEQSLSTFSSHMVNIIEILKHSCKGSLVLLDEVGAGTDPTEGAALAVSIVQKLKNSFAKVAVTTHYSEMKMYALDEERIENACCEFDVESLRPTYRLLIGVPGKSNAFAISKKLGLGDDIISFAKQMVSSDDTRFEDVVAKLEKSNRDVENERAELERIKQENLILNQKLKSSNVNLEQEINRQLDEAQKKAKQIVDSVSRDANALFEKINLMNEDIKKKKLSADLLDAKAALRAEINKLNEKADPIRKKKKENYKLPRPIVSGDSVIVVDINKEGTVIDPPDANKIALVRVGIMKMRISADNLKLTDKKDFKPKSIKTGTESRATRSVATELDIRGMDTIEGVMEIENFIDAAIMSGLSSVTIIHGKGTGVLRNAVRERLKTHKNVKSFRNGVFGEGEMGVTVVELK